MEKKYLIEFLGTLVIMTSKLLTEAHPVVMGIVYFSVYWMARGITTGFFNPFGPYAAFILGRGTYDDMIYNIASQFLGATAGILLFKPLKAYIQ
jgi:glycerol uptake facilitator-like aquaporin